MSIFKQYNYSLREHIANVQKGFDWINKNAPEILNNIPESDRKMLEQNIMQHDQSKYSMFEFDQYANYFNGPKNNDGSTPEDIRVAFDYAWNHHQKTNPHHWQYWALLRDDGTTFLDIPDIYLIEMICDWMSFAIKKNDMNEMFQWYESEKKKINMNVKSRERLERYMSIVKEKI